MIGIAERMSGTAERSGATGTTLPMPPCTLVDDTRCAYKALTEEIDERFGGRRFQDFLGIPIDYSDGLNRGQILDSCWTGGRGAAKTLGNLFKACLEGRSLTFSKRNRIPGDMLYLPLTPFTIRGVLIDD